MCSLLIRIISPKRKSLDVFLELMDHAEVTSAQEIDWPGEELHERE